MIPQILLFIAVVAENLTAETNSSDIHDIYFADWACALSLSQSENFMPAFHSGVLFKNQRTGEELATGLLVCFFNKLHTICI